MPSSCPTGKTVYRTRKEAKQRIKRLGGHYKLRAYQCHQCPNWHVTSWDAETTRMQKEYRKRMGYK